MRQDSGVRFGVHFLDPFFSRFHVHGFAGASPSRTAHNHKNHARGDWSPDPRLPSEEGEPHGPPSWVNISAGVRE